MITRDQLLTPGARFRVVNKRSHRLGEVASLSYDDGSDWPWMLFDDGCVVAFRLRELDMIDPAVEHPAPQPPQDAMTLRDQMAMAALTGLMAGRVPAAGHGSRDFSGQAYVMADAMLAERAKVRT